MVSLSTQQAIRVAQELSFCFDCGESFHAGCERENHPDHIPPKAVFAESDRNFPVKVACHRRCNGGNHLVDETIGQLLATLHGKAVREDVVPRVKGEPFPVKGSEVPFGCISHPDLAKEIWRWVRAFHAALYQQYLADDVIHTVLPPVPQGRMTPDGPLIEERLEDQAYLTELLKQNRSSGRLDEIVANNGKLHYICNWSPPMTDEKRVCVFGLNLYDWKSLGSEHFEPRGCVGRYVVNESELPPTASVQSCIHVPYVSLDRLDPFEVL